MVPDTISQSVFIALRALFQGDEIDLVKDNYNSFHYQLNCLNIQPVCVYSKTVIADEEPMILLKCFKKFWRVTLLWPRHNSDRIESPKILPYIDAFSSINENFRILNLNKEEDLLKCISYYKIKFHHESGKKYLTLISEHGSFKVKRRDFRSLSALKFKTFKRFAVDIKSVFLPAMLDEYTFENFKQLMETNSCTVTPSKYDAFRVDLAKYLGIKMKLDEEKRASSKFRLIAKYDEECEMMICRLNDEFILDEAECSDNPVIPVRQRMDSMDNSYSMEGVEEWEEKENMEEDHEIFGASNELPPNSKIRLII